jgi:hypothetical protein
LASFSNSSAGTGAGPCGPFNASSLTSWWSVVGASWLLWPAVLSVLRCSVLGSLVTALLPPASAGIELDATPATGTGERAGDVRVGGAVMGAVGAVFVISTSSVFTSASRSLRVGSVFAPSSRGSCGAVFPSETGASGCSREFGFS